MQEFNKQQLIYYSKSTEIRKIVEDTGELDPTSLGKIRYCVIQRQGGGSGKCPIPDVVPRIAVL